MKGVTKVICALALLALVSTAAVAADDQQEIRALTDEFCKAMVAKNLDAIDQVFDSDPGNIYYDINEGPLVGIPRLKQVWRAATSNFTLARFQFLPDMQIKVEGERALQTGKWEQVQVQGNGSQRQITGRATILWKKTATGWRVYHYHASITPGGR